jgi:hypothetical protein
MAFTVILPADQSHAYGDDADYQVGDGVLVVTDGEREIVYSRTGWLHVVSDNRPRTSSAVIR